MSEVNTEPDKKQFKLKISLVKSHADYYRYRILSFPAKILSSIRNMHGEYSIEIEDGDVFRLVLTPSFRDRKNKGA
jgi:hypothetical protein